MAFEIEEVEVAPYNPCELAKLLYPHLNINEGLDALFAEMSKREQSVEFWSDSCWTEQET